MLEKLIIYTFLHFNSFVGCISNLQFWSNENLKHDERLLQPNKFVNVTKGLKE